METAATEIIREIPRSVPEAQGRDGRLAAQRQYLYLLQEASVRSPRVKC